MRRNLLRATFLTQVISMLILATGAAEDSSRLSVANPAIIRAQSSAPARAIIRWQSSKESQEPYRISSIQIKHASYTRSVPKTLFDDLRWPELSFPAGFTSALMTATTFTSSSTVAMAGVFIPPSFSSLPLASHASDRPFV